MSSRGRQLKISLTSRTFLTSGHHQIRTLLVSTIAISSFYLQLLTIGYFGQDFQPSTQGAGGQNIFVPRKYFFPLAITRFYLYWFRSFQYQPSKTSLPKPGILRLRSVTSAAEARRLLLRKRSVQPVSEHFSTISNQVSASAVAYQLKIRPPSTSTVVPVTKSLPITNKIPSATSSDLPARLIR